MVFTPRSRWYIIRIYLWLCLCWCWVNPLVSCSLKYLNWQAQIHQLCSILCSLLHLLGFKSQFSLTLSPPFFVYGVLREKGLKQKTASFHSGFGFVSRDRERWQKVEQLWSIRLHGLWPLSAVLSLSFLLRSNDSSTFLARHVAYFLQSSVCVYPWKLTIVIQFYDLSFSFSRKRTKNLYMRPCWR